MGLCLETEEAAEALVTWFLPLGDERSVPPALAEAIIIELAGDLALAIVELVEVAAALVVEPVDCPYNLGLALPVCALVLGCDEQIALPSRMRWVNSRSVGSTSSQPLGGFPVRTVLILGISIN